MPQTFYFYDVETSGFNPKQARVMQFAGQRTDLNLKPVGQPHNVLITLSNDVLPDPEAVLITGITPQQTVSEGLTEVEFLKLFYEEIATADSIFVGFNTIRFDDEFMRYLNYRNFYDPYEWHYQDGRSRWDLLDLARMTRALRPEGIQWPFGPDGRASNRLQLLSSINDLEHGLAHDALSDVQASIALAQLLRQKQPKLFDYLLTHRHKHKVAEVVNSGQPFVYTSGSYPSETHKTTVVTKLADHPARPGALIFDLRHDPRTFTGLSLDDIVAAWQRRRDEEGLRLPVKNLRYNASPAIAPLSVLDQTSQDRLGIDLKKVEANLQALQAEPNFVKKLLQAATQLDKAQQTRLLEAEHDVDGRLYDGFFNDQDRLIMYEVRQAQPTALAKFQGQFSDQRLNSLLALYKARNFRQYLSSDEQEQWERYRQRKLTASQTASWAARYFKRLEELSKAEKLTSQQAYLLGELKLWAESILPLQGNSL